jgi:transposase
LHAQNAQALGADFEKKALHAVEQQRSDVQAARHDWHESQPQWDAARLGFLDETGTATNLTPAYGRAPRGQRCVGKAPAGYRHTSTFVCALRTTGLAAPLVLDGAMNGETFVAWVERMRVPTLRRGDIVVMDSLTSHKVAGVQQAIEAAGANVRYQPPYSPDLNPIEQVFAKLESRLCRAQHRTLQALWDGIGNLLDAFSAAGCSRYIRHCGYSGSG